MIGHACSLVPALLAWSALGAAGWAAPAAGSLARTEDPSPRRMRVRLEDPSGPWVYGWRILPGDAMFGRIAEQRLGGVRHTAWLVELNSDLDPRRLGPRTVYWLPTPRAMSPGPALLVYAQTDRPPGLRRFTPGEDGFDETEGLFVVALERKAEFEASIAARDLARRTALERAGELVFLPARDLPAATTADGPVEAHLVLDPAGGPRLALAATRPAPGPAPYEPLRRSEYWGVPASCGTVMVARERERERVLRTVPASAPPAAPGEGGDRGWRLGLAAFGILFLGVASALRRARAAG
jgi:hypothetical protein